MAYRSTTEIVRDAAYIKSGDAFFASFHNAWNTAENQIAKLETRQTYQEPDNASYRLLMSGDKKGALEALAQSRSADDAIYKMVRDKHIDFVRCRPVAFPLSAYLTWEMYAYKHNMLQGERIFWCDDITLKEFFATQAQHDFMIFDSALAFVHDYDPSGLIQGGWQITESDKIRDLLGLFSFVKANCQSLHNLKHPE